MAGPASSRFEVPREVDIEIKNPNNECILIVVWRMSAGSWPLLFSWRHRNVKNSALQAPLRRYWVRWRSGGVRGLGLGFPLQLHKWSENEVVSLVRHVRLLFGFEPGVSVWVWLEFAFHVSRHDKRTHWHGPTQLGAPRKTPSRDAPPHGAPHVERFHVELTKAWRWS